jgi:hypothetical protein
MSNVVYGEDNNHEISTTGYFLHISKNDNDVFYKMVDKNKEFWVMFDLIFIQDINSMSKLDEWVEVFNFYNDLDPNSNLKFCYRQLKNDIYEVGILTNGNQLLGNTIEVLRNEINTYELHVMRGIITNIEIYVNNKLKQTVLDTSIGDDWINRINFYCNYVTDVDTCLSHVIYNDKARIGNERIKVLNADVVNRLIANGTSGSFEVTELLNNNTYKDITGFGAVTAVENADDKGTTVKTYLNETQTNEFNVDSNKTKHEQFYLGKDPRTNAAFKAVDITGRKVIVETISKD